MRPVHHFKSNFCQLSQEALGISHRPVIFTDAVQMHEDDSHVRNICFIWEDGHKAFYNYAYLVSVDLIKLDSVNVLVLSFSSCTVTLKGYHLSAVFDLLMNHIPKTIAMTTYRYATKERSNEVVIVEILITND